MKYRFTKSSRSRTGATKRRHYILIGRKNVRSVSSPMIRMGDLFSQDALPHGRKTRRKSPFLVFLKRIRRRASFRCRRAIRRMATPQKLSLMSGALCASLLAALCFGTVMLPVLFGPYRRAGDPVTVPDFLKQSMDAVVSEKEDHIKLSVTYQYNQEYPAGTVISQSPAPGVTRRLYGKEKTLTVNLTVSREESRFTLPELVGMTRRDACLMLQNEGLRVKLVEEPSDADHGDKVLRSEPAVGNELLRGHEVTLYVGKTAAPLSVRVPDLFLLSETAAMAAVESSGLTVGTVTYTPSELPMGCVVSQSVEANAVLPEGSSLSFSISLGKSPSPKAVPSLFGMTVEEAREALRRVGLTVGEIQKIPHAAPAGTVIAQSITAGSPITSAITSVSITVSQ